MVKKLRKAPTPRPVVLTLTCLRCGFDKPDTEFYKTSSELYRSIKRVPVCKQCVEKIYNEIFVLVGNHKVATYRLCRKLDYPFLLSVYDMAEGQHRKTKTEIYKIYIQKVNSIGKQRSERHDFEASDDIGDKRLEVIKDEKAIKDAMMGDFEISNELIQFWEVIGLELEDYWYLQKQYDEYVASYDLSTKALIDLVKQICFVHLTIKKKRASGESVDKDLKMLQELMTSTNLKPNTASASSFSEATFGTLIKRWENEEPIPSQIWEDEEKIKHYLSVYFTGHTAKMLGKDVGVNKIYQKEMDKYTVEG